MNILFLVMNFLLIFVFLNGMVLKNASFFSSQKNSACSYLTSKLALESKWERYKYSSYAKKDLTASPKTPAKVVNSSPTRKDVFVSHRMKENISSLGKWNLATFVFSEPNNSLFLGELTARLLKELYAHTPFWKQAESKFPNLAQTFVLSFLDKKETAEILEDLFPDVLELQNIFYKMLKGSGSYDVLSKKGYPPLQDFFIFQAKKNSITSFPHASYPILKALFHPATVEKILSLEMSKWEKDHYLHSLTKEELKSFCMETFLPVKGKRFQELEPFLQFSHKQSKLEKLTCKDNKTHTYLNLTLPK